MRIEVKQLVRRFGGIISLDGVSLAVDDGELVALLGPSGSGKTTLLRLVAGLDFPDSGRILFDGSDATSLPIQKRRGGFVFQHYALFRHMSVAKNVAVGLEVNRRQFRMSRREIQDRASELLRLVQLPGFENRSPHQLSGGQLQRVALARALAIEPRILLLDEPFGALDAKVRKELRAWVRSLQQQLKITTIFVTHDQEEALELADRVVVMSQGRIEQVGTADEIYDKPNSPFVYGFIGESSSIPVKVEDGQV